MPKTTMKSRFHKEGLKGAVLRSITESENDVTSSEPKIPDGLVDPLKTRISSSMQGYAQDIRRQREGMKQLLHSHDKKDNKNEFITGEEYYKKVKPEFDERIGDLAKITNKRLSEIKQHFYQEIERERSSGNTAHVLELERQRDEAVTNMQNSLTAYKAQFQKQKTAFEDAEKSYQEKTKHPGPGEDLVLSAFEIIQDKGGEALTDAELEALREKDVNLRKFYEERLKRGMSGDGIFRHLGSNNNLQVNEKGEFSFDIGVYNRDKNIEAIDSVYKYEPDGRMTENSGIKKFNFPKEYMEAYKKGFFSTFSEPNATFNDAIFNMIRGFMARVVCDGINERIQSKEHEKTLRNDDGLRSAMNQVAKELPSGASPEDIKAKLKEKGYDLPTPTIKQIGDDIPPRGHFKVMDNWADKDTIKAMTKHQDTVLKSMFEQFKLNPKLGSANDQAVNLRGATPNVANAVITPTSTPAIRVGGR